MNHGDIVTVTAKKLDRKGERIWKCRFVESVGRRITLVGVFDSEIEHPELGIIRRGTVSYEFYWPDRYSNLFRFHQPNGDVMHYYGNVALPPKISGRTLSYVDLDVDVVIHPDGRTRILDEEEFRENSVRFCYPPKVVNAAARGLTELLELAREIGRGEDRFQPFNPSDLIPGTMADLR